MAVGSGALYFKPDGTSVPVQLSTGHIVPPSLWTMFCAGMYQHDLEPHDVDDPGGVVFRDPPGGGSGVTYWRVETSSGVHKWRQVEAASGGAGTGDNSGDWQWVATPAYAAIASLRENLLVGATSHANLASAYGLAGFAWTAPGTAGEEGYLTHLVAAGAVANVDAEVRIPIPAGYNPDIHSLTITVIANATPAPAVSATIDLQKVTLNEGTSDLCTTPAQGLGTARTPYVFNITDTGFNGTKVLNVAIRAAIDNTGGGAGVNVYVYQAYAEIA